MYSFVVGIVIAVAVAVMLGLQGDITTFDKHQGMRLVTYAAFIGAPLVYLLLVNLSLRKPTQLDERDKAIIQRSGRMQWLAVIFSLVAWTISLTEVYRDQGQVPIAFLDLIFMSVLIVGTLAQSLGILLGYWRMNRYG